MGGVDQVLTDHFTNSLDQWTPLIQAHSYSTAPFHADLIMSCVVEEDKQVFDSGTFSAVLVVICNCSDY